MFPKNLHLADCISQITFVPVRNHASSRVQSSCMTYCWTSLKLSHTVYAIYSMWSSFYIACDVDIICIHAICMHIYMQIGSNTKHNSSWSKSVVRNLISAKKGKGHNLGNCMQHHTRNSLIWKSIRMPACNLSYHKEYRSWIHVLILKICICVV